MVRLTMPPYCTPLAGPGATSPRCRPRGAHGGRIPSRSAPPGTPGRAAQRASPPAAHTRLGPVSVSSAPCGQHEAEPCRTGSAAIGLTRALQPCQAHDILFRPCKQPHLAACLMALARRLVCFYTAAGPHTCSNRSGRTMGYNRYARAVAVAVCNALERSGISSMCSFNRLRTGRHRRGCHLRLGMAGGSTATTGFPCRQHNGADRDDVQAQETPRACQARPAMALLCSKQSGLARQPAVAAPRLAARHI